MIGRFPIAAPFIDVNKNSVIVSLKFVHVLHW